MKYQHFETLFTFTQAFRKQKVINKIIISALSFTIFIYFLSHWDGHKFGKIIFISTFKYSVLSFAVFNAMLKNFHCERIQLVSYVFIIRIPKRNWISQKFTVCYNRWSFEGGFHNQCTYKYHFMIWGKAGNVELALYLHSLSFARVHRLLYVYVNLFVLSFYIKFDYCLANFWI